MEQFRQIVAEIFGYCFGHEWNRWYICGKDVGSQKIAISSCKYCGILEPGKSEG